MWKKFLAASAVASGIIGLLGGGGAFAVAELHPNYVSGQNISMYSGSVDVCVHKTGGYSGDSIIADIRGTNYEKQIVFGDFADNSSCVLVEDLPIGAKLKYVTSMGIKNLMYMEIIEDDHQTLELFLDDATTVNKYLRSYGQTATRVKKSSATINFDANGGSGAVPVVSGIGVGTSVTLPKNQLTRTDYRFGGWNTKADGTGTAYEDEAVIPITEAGTLQLYAQWIADVAVLDYGTSVNGKLKTAAGTSLSGGDGPSTTDSNIQAVKMANALPDNFDTEDPANIISDSYSLAKVYAWFDDRDIDEDGNGDGVIYIYSDASTIKGGSNASYMFDNMQALTDISALAEFDMSNTKRINDMFRLASALEDISALANWNTSSMQRIDGLFAFTKVTSTDALATVQHQGNDYTSWNVSNVVHMESVFWGAAELEDISGLTNWDTSSAENMSFMFGGNEVKPLSDISAIAAWNTSKVKRMDNMLQRLSITNVDALETRQHPGKNYVSWDVSSVEDMSAMLGGNQSLNDISGIAKWNIASVTNMNSMLGGTAITSAEALRTIQHEGKDYVSWNVSGVKRMDNLFMNDAELADIAALATWDTGSVEDMSQMFCGASALSNISALTNWNTSSIEDISGMFREASSLSNIAPLANWDTSSVMEMSQLFYRDAAITDVSALRYWNTSSLKYLNYAFSRTKIIDANALRTMQYEGKDYISWNVSGVTDLSCIFEGTNTLTDVSALESWNIQSGASMTRAFNGVAVPAASLPSWYQQ